MEKQKQLNTVKLKKQVKRGGVEVVRIAVTRDGKVVKPEGEEVVEVPRTEVLAILEVICIKGTCYPPRIIKQYVDGFVRVYEDFATYDVDTEELDLEVEIIRWKPSF